MRKRAVFVMGPESAGTRLHTRLFIAGGFFGDDGHDQRLDRGFEGAPDRIVFRRSAPHGQVWPNVPALVMEMQRCGYEVQAVAVARARWAVVKSQVAAGHVTGEKEAIENVSRAYEWIASGLAAAGIPYLVSTYEALVNNFEAHSISLLRWAGVPAFAPPAGIEVFDANLKWAEAVLANGGGDGPA
jgi:hypothetical protein